MGERLLKRLHGLRTGLPPGGHPLRWGVGGAAAAAAALVVAGAVTVAGAGAAGADPAPAVGTASAQSLQVTPHDGSLAVGAVFGVALAGVTGDFAKAQSEGVDLGAIGTALTSYNCGSNPSQAQQDLVPSPLTTESGDPGAAQGTTVSPSTSDYAANEFVQATTAPYGLATTTYAGPLSDPTGAVSVSGMVSRAWSGVVNGVEESGASSDIASLTLGAGTVVIDGLDWQSVYPTGGGQPSGSFTIGKILIDGTALPDLADLSTVASAINAALGTLGLEVQLPTSYVQQGIEYVDPLQIEVVPSATRDQILDSIVDAVQPTYFQIANGLESGFASDSSPYNALGPLESSSDGQELARALCNTDTPITVADITIASLDGGGYFNLALGGVDSTDAPLQINPYNLTALGLGNLSLPASSQFLPGTAGTPGTTGSLGTPGTTTATAPAAPTAALHQAIGARATGFSPGGPLLAAALGGVGLLFLLIEGDRRLMRRAQRAALRNKPTAEPPEE